MASIKCRRATNTSLENLVAKVRIPGYPPQKQFQVREVFGVPSETGGHLKRVFRTALATAVVALSAASDASAQAAISVAGTATIPTGDYSDFVFGAGDGANTGWQGTVVALFGVGDGGLSVGPRVYYGSNNHDTDGDKTNLFGGTAVASYSLGDPAALNPFLFGEFGVMSNSFKSESVPASADTKSTAVVWSGGAGLGFPIGGVNGFVAAAYTAGLSDNSAITYVGVYAGVTFAVGGG